MNKYQRFAVNHYLKWHDPKLEFDIILAAAQANDGTVVQAGDAYQHLTLEEIADDIYQMAADLEELL